MLRCAGLEGAGEVGTWMEVSVASCSCRDGWAGGRLVASSVDVDFRPASRRATPAPLCAAEDGGPTPTMPLVEEEAARPGPPPAVFLRFGTGGAVPASSLLTARAARDDGRADGSRIGKIDDRLFHGCLMSTRSRASQRRSLESFPDGQSAGKISSGGGAGGADAVSGTVKVEVPVRGDAL